MRHIILPVALMLAQTAWSSEPIRWEISGGAIALAAYEKSGPDDGFQVALGARASRYLTQSAAVFSSVVVSWRDPGTEPSVTSLGFIVGPQLNLGQDPAKAFYFLSGIGIRLLDFSPDVPATAHFSYELAIGKRFQLLEHVTWSPELNLTGIDEASAEQDGNTITIAEGVQWSARLFQFSILF